MMAEIRELQGKINTLYAALTLSNEANRQLEAKVEDIRGIYKAACKDRTRLHTKIGALQAKIEELEAEVEYWEGRTENGSNAKHWPEFGPGGR